MISLGYGPTKFPWSKRKGGSGETSQNLETKHKDSIRTLQFRSYSIRVDLPNVYCIRNPLDNNDLATSPLGLRFYFPLFITSYP